ncbi:holo-[acyl-carrier-protein] synthase [Marinobacterium zhoushanense]|uniref:Holo-[acyl-carrier-protein] synthase n=1 Tax=Marinobacterium zhoushanense TaxID=1679163 RepID=A0ABQ1K5X3_9GAMM|nr:holo-ACP synthase [Marinobacterium zhoushanense]GGB89036.1 holo-[acyl-carrier-protein] synthase [Marinobacterium zhoushanense]
MIAGLGTDIVEIARIEAALERTPRLAQRILTEAELVYFEQSNMPARFLAKRFAAKEAAVKALGTGIAKGVGWHQLSIYHADSGRPLLELSGRAAEIADTLNISGWHLSYSDEQHYVVATVIAEAFS